MLKRQTVIYTIGYSSFDHNINAIVDVRSSPYSQYKSEFNREKLKMSLNKENISYVFLGEECGARVSNSSCYINGKVDYSLVSETDLFKDGIKRLLNGAEKYSLALMCAEKDPITCHRTILVCRHLIKTGICINHVLENGDIELHEDSEKRLLKLFKLHHPDLFRTEQDRLNEAYSRQGEKIAYEAEDENEIV